jgi:Spy/CpxP family protein refolding chaperone
MREPPHRHAGAQHEQAHLHQYDPCSRERIHTSSNDRYCGALVTILDVEALVPSACRERAGVATNKHKKNCNRPDWLPVITRRSEKIFRENKMKQTMKRNVLTFVAAGAMALGGLVIVQAQPDADGGGRCHGGHAFGLRHLTEKLDLTSDQETKVQPILDAAKPQIAAIHQEAMQKIKGVMDSTLSQVRPLLTADQQKKLDAIQKAHQDMMTAHKELHDAMQQ